MGVPERPDRILAVDQGGHASRAFLFDRRGERLGGSTVAVHDRRPEPGRIEQDAESLLASVRRAIREAATADAPIAAAGLAVQRSSVVCWDRETGRPLSSVLSWQDVRGEPYLEPLREREADIRRRTGLPLSAHYGASKLRWCLDHLPEIRDALDDGRLAWGPLAAFLAARLTGDLDPAVDPANASRTQLWNLATRDWDPDLLPPFGLPREPFGHCVPTRHDRGTIDTPAGPVPLVVVTGDQSAALFAWGEPAAGTVYANLGTGAFLQTPAESPHPGLLFSIAYADEREARFTLEGTVNGAGAALDRAAADLEIRDLPERLPRWLETIDDPPLFLNGVSGLGTPFMIPDFPSRFLGEGSPDRKMVAVAESILFLLKVNLETMREAGTPCDRIVATGGLARVDPLCRRLADLAGVPVLRPAEVEATACGTAYLTAGRPTDWIGIEKADRFDPKENRPLAARYRRWRTVMDEALAT